jgi:beta-lactamase superfamily II metal-dependent hydrolase
MSTPQATVTVRMYDVGFGDALLVTVRQGEAVWRMLVDCGAVSASRTRPLEESVDRIVEDLSALAGDGSPPRLDVIVATHHHVDHIAGFAYAAWERVEVGEVWVPYVEDPDDQDAKNLRAEQTAAAHRLQALIGAVGARLAADDADGRGG